MNSNQLATLDEAKAIAAKLGAMGGSVKPLTSEAETSGIYVPQYVGPYAAPQNGSALFLHFRFYNGASGFNVGLIRETMKYFPFRWPLMLSTEINAAANSGDDRGW